MLTVAAIERVLDRPGADSSCPCTERGVTVELAPEVVLPIQLDHLAGRRTTPERRLMLAVLEDAVHVYQVGCLSTHTGGRLQARETAEWFGSDDTSSPFSFVTICEVFGLDPDYLRAGLRRWKDRHTTAGPRPRGTIPLRIRHVSGSRHHVTPARSPRLRACARPRGGAHGIRAVRAAPSPAPG